MRIWRVVRHAPGRPDSPSPALYRHAPSKPSPRSPLKTKCMPGVNISCQLPTTPTKTICKVTLLFMSGILELRVLSLVIVLLCWAVAASGVGKGPISGQNLNSTRHCFVPSQVIKPALKPAPTSVDNASVWILLALGFEEGDPVLEVMGDRELGFFPGTAVGSAYKGFDYTSEAGAKAAPVCFVSSYHHQQGNRLISADQQGTHTAQESTEEAAPWQLSPIFFKAEDWSGAKAGTTSPNSIHDCSMNDGRGGNTHGNGNNTIDGIYKHVSSNHENSWNNDSREVDRPSLHTNVCASRYDRASQSSGTLAGSSVQGVGNASLPSGWSRCLDYCNGGCVFRLPTQSPSRLHMHHSQQGAQHSQQGVQHSQQGVQHSQQGVQHSQQGVQHSQQGEQHSQEGVQHSQQGEQHSQEGVQHSQQGDGHPGSSSQGAEGAEEHDKHLTVLALYEDMQSPAAEVTVPDGKPDAKPEELLKPVTNKVTQVRCSAAQRLG
eukprot:672530-Pelagomonas_calceolata.AAC.6